MTQTVQSPKQSYLGIFLFELFSTMVLVGAGTFVAYKHGGVWPAVTFGAALAVLAVPLGSYTGCHLNPAVTFGLWGAGEVRAAAVPRYLLGQFCGAVLGSFFLKSFYPAADRGATPLGAALPGKGVSFWKATLSESLATLLLVFVIVGAVMLVKRGDLKASLVGLLGGLALAAAIYFFGPFTGASVNPARALSPVIVSGTWLDMTVKLFGQFLLIYIVAGLVIGAIVGFAFRYLGKVRPA